MNDRGIAEADMHGRGAGDAIERAVEGLQPELARLVRSRLHIGLVDLHDVGAGREQVLDLLVDRRCVIERQFLLIVIEVVLSLLRHGKRPGHGHLDRAIRIGAQELHVANLDRMLATHLADNARHRIGMTGAVESRTGIVDVDPFERGREAVGIAFTPHLAVGDDVETGALLVADRQPRCIVLRLVEPFGRHPPQFARAHPRRKAPRQILAVDQPVRLGIRPDQRGRQHLL